MLFKNLEGSWQPWSWMGQISQIFLIHTLKVLPGNMMLRGWDIFTVFVYIWTTFASLGRKMNGYYMCSLLRVLYIGKFWQSFYRMYDLMWFCFVRKCSSVLEEFFYYNVKSLSSSLIISIYLSKIWSHQINWSNIYAR
jgi:hypothetical protein